MEQRTILPDCCEDWIISYGDYYGEGEEFCCLECGTQWQKTGEGKYGRKTDKRSFVERRRTHGENEFRYLAPEEGPEPVTQRCCAHIILKHGPHTKVESFVCPVCRTEWKKETVNKAGMRIPCFSSSESSEPITIQRGRTRMFLVPVSHYSPPRE